jgi:hypothetical protein
MRIKVATAFVEPAHRRVQSEEGPYDARCGYNVIARSEADKQGGVTEYIHTGGQGIPSLFQDADRAQRLIADKAKTLGINPALWQAISSHNIHTLPDYVTNPHRPEYN